MAPVCHFTAQACPSKSASKTFSRGHNHPKANGGGSAGGGDSTKGTYFFFHNFRHRVWLGCEVSAEVDAEVNAEGDAEVGRPWRRRRAVRRLHRSMTKRTASMTTMEEKDGRMDNKQDYHRLILFSFFFFSFHFFCAQLLSTSSVSDNVAPIVLPPPLQHLSSHFSYFVLA